ncbi:hypothetical protein N480_14335 [Pseudoalteromonas luteoviolacea S2607]|uniref:hypothetical protein n=1 Tax=Pseudoalteromonas luteoviolacea TaxID=43657 RepID=UPI0007B072E1|nr:hypothetical protein [Pseudoalteromonas luteoviolacea]KZN37918.1 hypothetical protein N480_14335 [Pseudoalteromonas luteoviolacea S2607]
MNRLFGNNVVKIEAPQDRSELKFVVLENDTDFDTNNVRFFNSDNSPITIDFSHLSIEMIFDPERGSMSLGEFEYVKSIDNGFEVFGDFGIIWVYCDSSSPKL